MRSYDPPAISDTELGTAIAIYIASGNITGYRVAALIAAGVGEEFIA